MLVQYVVPLLIFDKKHASSASFDDALVSDHRRVHGRVIYTIKRMFQMLAHRYNPWAFQLELSHLLRSLLSCIIDL